MSKRFGRYGSALLAVPVMLGLVVIARVYPPQWGEANAQDAQPAALETADLASAQRDARDVPPYIFTDRFEQYQGSWVRFQNYSLHCDQMRDRSVQCTNTNGTAAVAVFYDRIATLGPDGQTSPKEFHPYDRSLACQNPLFFFSGTVPTTNPNFVGVHVDTLYCQ